MTAIEYGLWEPAKEHKKLKAAFIYRTSGASSMLSAYLKLIPYQVEQDNMPVYAGYALQGLCVSAGFVIYESASACLLRLCKPIISHEA